MASTNFGKREICEYIKGHFPKGSTCLDVGACDGKWSDLLGDYLTMDAVEIFEPNVSFHNLRQKYRQVWCRDILDVEYDFYDLIIFGDVIEHMTTYKAQKVLEYARTRCKDMIIGVPYQYKQGVLYGNPHEVHLQDDLTEALFRVRYPGYELLCAQGNYAYWHIPPVEG